MRNEQHTHSITAEFPPPLAMQPLNVLIGPNGSGKSNLVEAIGLLRSTATKLTAPMRGPGGGVKEWIWKGANNGHALVDVVIDYPAGTQPLRHMFEFIESASRLEVVDEVIEKPRSDPWHDEPFFYYHFENGQLWTRGEIGGTSCAHTDVEVN